MLHFSLYAFFKRTFYFHNYFLSKQYCCGKKHFIHFIRRADDENIDKMCLPRWNKCYFFQQQIYTEQNPILVAHSIYWNITPFNVVARYNLIMLTRRKNSRCKNQNKIWDYSLNIIWPKFIKFKFFTLHTLHPLYGIILEIKLIIKRNLPNQLLSLRNVFIPQFNAFYERLFKQQSLYYEGINAFTSQFNDTYGTAVTLRQILRSCTL